MTKTDNGVTTTYTYDNNGNMLTKTGNGEQQQLTYNVLNQLMQAQLTTTQGTTTVAYTYDADGIRVGKTVNVTNVTNYLVDKNVPYAQVLEEQWTAGGQSGVTRYTYGDALVAQTTNGVSHFYQYDGLGSTRSLTDATGAVTDAYAGACPERSRRDAYGQLLEQTGASANPYLYRGEQYDPDTDAYYLRARYYQPGLGRFLTTDPIEGMPGDPLGQHRYLYGHSNPTNYIDPSGKKEYQDLIVTVGIIANLAAMGGSFTEAGREAYADFGEYIFPDAFILGATGSVGFIRFLANFVGAQGVLPLVGDRNEGWGGEVLFSISSAQIAFFSTRSHGVEIGYGLSPCPISAEIYQGMVWNLWNVANYEGPFHSLSVNVPIIGRSLFWDAINSFENGSWGISRTVFSMPDSLKLSVAYNYVAYRQLTPLKVDLPCESNVATSILSAIYATTLFMNAQTMASPMGVLRLTWDTTVWIQTGLSKYYWNRSSGGYSVETRQQNDRDKFPYFRSGPTLFYAGQYM